MSRNAFKGNARGRHSSVPSGFSTKQVARLARVRIGRILFALRTTGNWRGVEPLCRSPLVWPQGAINRVLWRAPDRALMTTAERVVCDLMDIHGLDLDCSWPLVELLLAKPDPGRDPTFVLNEIDVLAVIAMALIDRLYVTWPMLGEPQKARALRSLSYVVYLLDGLTNDVNPRGDNNENN